MPVDNTLYDFQSNGWWDENHFLHTLKTGINPARFAYFQNILFIQKAKKATLSILDIGCGGGFLSEEFVRLGHHVSGIDISIKSLETAVRHAVRENLIIHYQAASADALPFASASFDVVVCCDVLEHVPDVGKVVSESRRVLKADGVYLFDTINRTTRSFFETILVAQEFPPTRFFPEHTHAWEQFIKPHELTGHLERASLQIYELTGLGPGISPLSVFANILLLKLGRITFAEFGRKLKFQVGGGLDGSYIGYAKPD